MDMLNDFVLPDGKLSCGQAAQDIVEPIRQRLEAARDAGHTVIYVCDNHKPDDPEFRMFPVHCVAGTQGAEVVAELAPEPGDIVIKKRRYSAFFGTDLDLHLRENGIEELTLVGVCTNICVMYTAADARNRNYDVIVPRDSVASFSDEAHEFALKELKNTLGAQIC